MHDLRVAGAQTGAPAQKALHINIFVTVSKTPAARLVFDPDTFVTLLSANAGSKCRQCRAVQDGDADEEGDPFENEDHQQDVATRDDGRTLHDPGVRP